MDDKKRQPITPLYQFPTGVSSSSYDFDGVKRVFEDLKGAIVTDRVNLNTTGNKINELIVLVESLAARVEVLEEEKRMNAVLTS